MYQSPPTRLSLRGGQVPDHRPQPRQVERLVVQRQDRALQLQRDLPLLGQLGLSRASRGPASFERDAATAGATAGGDDTVPPGGHGYLRARQYPFRVRLRGRVREPLCAARPIATGTSIVSELITVHIRSTCVHQA